MTNHHAILASLYRAEGQFVPRAVFGATPGVLAELRQLGYQIEEHPHHGCRLIASPDRLWADDLQARRPTRIIGSEIITFAETASTNDVAAYLAASGRREGLVVIAETQTKGRGRHGRTWVSPRGRGLWFSVICRPDWPARAMSRLTVAASVAVVRAIQAETGLDARIKWPNDVILHNRKVAGILMELSRSAAILGVGINVNCHADDFPASVAAIATSLSLAAGREIDRPALAARVLGELDDIYAQSQTDFAGVVSAWAERCTTLGRQITVTIGHRRIVGHAQALDDDGALLVRGDSGEIHRILGAEAVLEKI